MFNPVMKICPEIRCENANRLAEDAGGQQGFIEATGLTQSLVSAYLNGKKDIGPSVARKIEAAFGKERGWLDHEHSRTAIDAPEDVRKMVGSLLQQDPAIQQFFVDVYWATRAICEKRLPLTARNMEAGDILDPGKDATSKLIPRDGARRAGE